MTRGQPNRCRSRSPRLNKPVRCLQELFEPLYEIEQFLPRGTDHDVVLAVREQIPESLGSPKVAIRRPL
jgi:hypothetical protein